MSFCLGLSIRIIMLYARDIGGGMEEWKRNGEDESPPSFRIERI